jgi:hypothetical protein
MNTISKREFKTRLYFFLLVGLIGLLSGVGLTAQAANPEPADWYAGDMHVHRSCGGSPEALSSLYSKMTTNNLATISLLADMGNGEVQNPVTDLPLVTGEDAAVSTSGRIVHWDAEWHWDATYGQYTNQALGGHLVALGLGEADQIWEEYTYPILNWAHQQNGIAGFVHMQYLDNAIPQSLNCCIPIEYPVEVALGSADFIAEDVTGGDSAIQAYYRLLNNGFRPGFAAGTDYPCGVSELGSLLTYVQVAGGQITYRNWIEGIKAGRTVVSRNGHNEFLNLTVNDTAKPGDEIPLKVSGSLPVTITWTANQNLSGTIELVKDGVVVASKQASVTSSTSVSMSTTVNFTKSGWLTARRMGSTGHQSHTAAVFVTVNNQPVRVSASDAQFYVQWIDNLLTKTSPGGAWSSYFVNSLSAAQERYNAAKAIYQQIALEAGAAPQPLTITTASLPDGVVGLAYSAALTASGGIAAYSWSISSGLPAGLTFSNGRITGTPTTSGSFSFTVNVSDASNPQQTATKLLSINISATNPGGIIGYNGPGTLTDTISDTSGSYINATRFLATANLNVTTIKAKVLGITGKYKCAIYSDNSGSLQNLLKESSEVTNPATGWQTFNLTSAQRIQNGTYYWLAIWSDLKSPNAGIYADATGATTRWTNALTYGAWPNPVTTSGGNSYRYSIYAEDAGSGSNLPPTVATTASASINPVAGTSASLSVLGVDDGGETNLSYRWATTGTPPAPVSFSANGTNAAKNTTATFTKAGIYNLLVTIKDQANLTVTSSVTVTVNQTLTAITVSPTSVSVVAGATQQFTATAKDQFAANLIVPTTVTWSVSGGGTINLSGLFTAGNSTGGLFTVTATSSGKSGSANISVTAGINILGNNLIGTSNDVSSANDLNGWRFRATSSFIAKNMRINLASALTGRMKLAIYADNNGRPGALLMTTNEVINPASGWVTFSLTSSYAITQWNYYWLADWANVIYTAKCLATGGTARYIKKTYGNWPNPLSGTLGPYSNSESIFVY